MKNFSPFFIIGSIGVIVTAVLHIALAMIISQASLHATFFVLYPLFMAFMLIGFRQTLKAYKKLKPVEQRISK